MNNHNNKKITIWLVFVFVLSLLAVVAFVSRNSRQILLNKAAETTKKTSHLNLTINHSEVPINGKLQMTAILKDENNQPLTGKKIVFTYNSEWNYGEYKVTDSQGKAEYELSTANALNRTGFCGRGGSRNVPSTYQAVAYFQGDGEYKSSMTRANFGVINSGESGSGTPASATEDKISRIKPPGVIYWGWDYWNLDPVDAPEDLIRKDCQPGTTYVNSGDGKTYQCKNDPNIKTSYGPFGSQYYQEWNQLSYAKLDEYLAKAKEMIITLPDGQKIPKPVIFGIPFFGGTGDNTPDSVKAKVAAGGDGGSYQITPAGCATMKVPKYCDTTWQAEYKKMVDDLGSRYDGKLDAMLITIGYDSEAVWVKNINNCDYQTALAPICPKAKFEALIKNSISWYRSAFPNTPVYLQGLHPDAQYAIDQNPPVGMKTNNWTASSGKWVYKSNADFNGESKLWINNPGLPHGVESSYGTFFMDGTDNLARGVFAGTYWMLVGMMAHRPDFIDFHADHWEAFLKIPYLSNFVTAQMGKTADNIPFVWTVLRELEDKEKKENYDCWLSGLYGDYMVYLYRRENITGNKTVPVKREELPSETRYQHYTMPPSGARYDQGNIPLSITARRTDQASGNNFMSFDIDNGWFYARENQPYTLNLVYLDKGTDKLIIEYKNKDGELKQNEIVKTASNKWQARQIVLTDAYFNDQLEGMADIRINNNQDGDETIHRLEIWGNGDQIIPEVTDPDGTPRPTGSVNPVSPTPTASPTPVPKGDLQLNLALKLQGVLSQPPEDFNSLRIKVSINPENYDQLREKTIEVGADDNGLWTGEAIFDDIYVDIGYEIIIKSVKHLSRTLNDVVLEEGENEIDFTDQILLSGDINGDDIINSYDLSLIRNNLFSEEKILLDRADLNFDGIINAVDFSLAISGLKEQE